MMSQVEVPSALDAKSKKAHPSKQFTELAGIPILIHTLRRFAALDAIDEIWVAVRENEMEGFRERLEAGDPAGSGPGRVREAEAIGERHASFFLALAEAAEPGLRGAGQLAGRRLGVGRAQIKRPRRRDRRVDRGGEPGHPDDVGCGLLIDLDRLWRILRPALGQNVGGIADQMRRAEARGGERLFHRRDTWRHQRFAMTGYGLQIDMIMPRIDR